MDLLENGQKYKKSFRLLVRCRQEETKAFEKYHELLKNFIKLFKNKKYNQSLIDLKIYEDRLADLLRFTVQNLKLKPIRDFVAILEKEADLNKYSLIDFKYEPVVTYFPGITSNLIRIIHDITSLDRRNCTFLFDNLFLGNWFFQFSVRLRVHWSSETSSQS